jgi:LuxR family maltose regulon positive regulatory protein
MRPRLLADHLFSLTLDGQKGTIAALLRSFPAGASADHPELALAHAAVQLAHGRLEEAATQLALAESHVQNAPPARRQLAVAIASLRLALARRSRQFTEVIEQVNLLDASVAAGSNEPIGIGSELRAVALMNLGIVDMWSGDSTTPSATFPREQCSPGHSADRTWSSRVVRIKGSRQRSFRLRPHGNGPVRQ